MIGKLCVRLACALCCMGCWALLMAGQCSPPALQEPDTELSSERSALVDASPMPDQVRLDVPPGDGCRAIELLDHKQWRQVPREQDPYRSMAPSGKCEDVAYKLEDGVIEVETGICTFFTVDQTLSRDLKAGQTLKVIFWHLQLTAASSANAYVSFTIGTTSIYVKKIPIPSGPEVYEETITLKQDFKKGEPLYFHIHNHGSNSWKLLALELGCQ